MTRPGQITIPVHAHELLTAHVGTQVTALTPRPPRGDHGHPILVRSGVAPRQRRLTTASRARILRIHPVLLGDLTQGDAVACGYRGIAQLRVHWIRTHERDPLWDAGFRTSALGDEDAADRWATHWAHRTAWATLLQHDPTHRPRLLHRRSEHGYTASPREAMQAEPEALTAPRTTRTARPRRAMR